MRFPFRPARRDLTMIATLQPRPEQSTMVVATADPCPEPEFTTPLAVRSPCRNFATVVNARLSFEPSSMILAIADPSPELVYAKSTDFDLGPEIMLALSIEGRTELDAARKVLDAISRAATKNSGGSLPECWADRLIFDPNVSDSSPVVKGTWITVAHVVSLIVDNWTWNDILRCHPEMVEDDIRTCLAYHCFGELENPCPR